MTAGECIVNLVGFHIKQSYLLILIANTALHLLLLLGLFDFDFDLNWDTRNPMFTFYILSAGIGLTYVAGRMGRATKLVQKRPLDGARCFKQKSVYTVPSLSSPFDPG